MQLVAIIIYLLFDIWKIGVQSTLWTKVYRRTQPCWLFVFLCFIFTAFLLEDGILGDFQFKTGQYRLQFYTYIFYAVLLGISLRKAEFPSCYSTVNLRS